jgi:hypothetical protein
MGKTDTKQSHETQREDERIDLRKCRKRITTYEEKQFILETRKKYQHEDLSAKMKRISDKLREEGRL